MSKFVPPTMAEIERETPMHDSLKKLSMEQRLQLATLHKKLCELDWRASFYNLEWRGQQSLMNSRDFDWTAWNLLDVKDWGVSYHHDCVGLDRSHSLYVYLTKGGNFRWRHQATAEGEMYGRSYCQAQGSSAASLDRHFVGRAPTVAW